MVAPFFSYVFILLCVTLGVSYQRFLKTKSTTLRVNGTKHCKGKGKTTAAKSINYLQHFPWTQWTQRHYVIKSMDTDIVMGVCVEGTGIIAVAHQHCCRCFYSLSVLVSKTLFKSAATLMKKKERDNVAGTPVCMGEKVEGGKPQITTVVVLPHTASSWWHHHHAAMIRAVIMPASKWLGG